MRISAHGLTMDPPPGWDARIRVLDTAPPGAAPAPTATTNTAATNSTAATATTAGGRRFSYFPVLHAADFALPDQRGDFGSGAVEIMGATDAFIALLEYHPDSVGTALFANAGLPRQVSPDAFSPQQLQRSLRGQAGWQRFFVERGRPFCLYVVLGGYARRAEVVPRVNTTLASIDVAPA